MTATALAPRVSRRSSLLDALDATGTATPAGEVDGARLWAIDLTLWGVGGYDAVVLMGTAMVGEDDTEIDPLDLQVVGDGVVLPPDEALALARDASTLLVVAAVIREAA